MLLETHDEPYPDEPNEWKRYSDSELTQAWYQQAALYQNQTAPAPSANSDGCLFQNYQAQAGEGDICAQYVLGQMLFHGVLTQVNLFQAALWFSRASESGCPFASYELAKMCRFGYGMGANQKSATELYRKAYIGFQKVQEKGVNQAVELKMEVIRKYIFDHTDLGSLQNRDYKVNNRLIVSHVHPVTLLKKEEKSRPMPMRSKRRRRLAEHPLSQSSRICSVKKNVLPETVIKPDIPLPVTSENPDRSELPEAGANVEEEQPRYKEQDSPLEAIPEPDVSFLIPSESSEQSEPQEVEGAAAAEQFEHEKQDTPSEEVSKPYVLLPTDQEILVQGEFSEENAESAAEQSGCKEQNAPSEPESPLYPASESSEPTEPPETDIEPASDESDLAERDIPSEPVSETDVPLSAAAAVTYGEGYEVQSVTDPQNFKEAVRILESIPMEPGEPCAVLDGCEVKYGEIDRLEIYKNALLISVMIDDLRKPFPVSMVGKTVFVGPECYQNAQKATLQY